MLKKIKKIEKVKNKNKFVYDITTKTGYFLSNDIYVKNCGSHSVEFLKKYGLQLENLGTSSSPAKHAHTLTGHLNTFLASMQTYWAGALGLAYLNTFYAPMLISLNNKEIQHEAQYLIFSLSQNAFSRGSQTLFLDANIDFKVPEFLWNIPCIVQGGNYCTEFYFEDEDVDVMRKNSKWRKHRWVFHKEKNKYSKAQFLKDYGSDQELTKKQMGDIKCKLLTFGDFNEQAQIFAKLLMEVWDAGDSKGQIFAFPKFQCHINHKTFDDPEQRELFQYACEMAANKGLTNFVFDRDSISLSQCCRLKETVTDMSMIENPETLRFTGFQNVTINLPQAAYRAKGNLEKTINEIKKTMDLALQAHIQKRKFIESLMDSKEKPLWQIRKIWHDGKPYVDLKTATNIMGILGLNECVQRITGKQLHENDEVFKIGVRIITEMFLYTKELAKKNEMKIVLEESPAESAGVRLAKIDMNTFPDSKKYIKGNQKTGNVYYTNSVHLEASINVDIIERIEKQAVFTPLIEAGSITHVFLGEQQVTSESIFNLVEKTFKNTKCDQLTISPELVFCADCGHIHRGFYFLDEEEN